MNIPMLTLLTLVPLIGGILICGLEKKQLAVARGLSFFFCALSLAITLFLWWRFDASLPELQFEERFDWIPSLGVEYRLGLDGLSLTLLLLTSVIIPFALLLMPMERAGSALYFSLHLWIQAGLFGTFTALNFVHWFFFWELTLIPAFFLVRGWSGILGSAAALQFFIYTLIGSVTLLLSFQAMYLATGSFDFSRLAELAASGELSSAFSAKLGWYDLSESQLNLVLFLGVFLAFAIKVPLFPFHGWLPQTYAAAPAPITMVLTGLLSKMGLYGVLRILLPIFPEPMRMFLKPLLWLAVISIVFSALAALAQKNIKRILAYSSMNHLGYCWLAVFAVMQSTHGSAEDRASALNGVAFQLLNHGITAAALFALVALVEKRTGDNLQLETFGGLRQVAPIFSGFMGITLFASIGLPGMGGFVAEFLIFRGTLLLAPIATVCATLGLLISAVFLLKLFNGMFWGPLVPARHPFPDLTSREQLLLLPSLGLIFLMGIYPRLFLDVVNPLMTQLAQSLTH